MAKIVGIAGSLRQGSYNLALLRAAEELVPDGSELRVFTLHGIPLLNTDDEASTGLPPAVVELKNAIIQADGVILATPEYNNGIPGVFKNAIDWLSRPSSDITRVFGGKPFSLIGASMGGFGTILSQNAWLSVLHMLGAKTWSENRMLVSRANQCFDTNGQLSDTDLRERLGAFVRGFIAHVDAVKQ